MLCTWLRQHSQRSKGTNQRAAWERFLSAVVTWRMPGECLNWSKSLYWPSMGKRIWLSIHPRNFGSDKIGRTYVLPFMYAWVKFCISKRPGRFRGKSHGHPKRDKNGKKAKSFFRLDFKVYIDKDNRERASVRDKKGDQLRWKKNMKIL